MHDVADVEAKNPVICAEVLDSERTSSRYLVPLLHLELVHLLKGLERYLELLLLSHAILEVVPPFPVVQVCNRVELKLDVDELLDDGVRLLDLFLEDLHLVWQVVRAGAVGGSGAVATAFRHVASPVAASEGRVHAEVLLAHPFVPVLPLSA